MVPRAGIESKRHADFQSAAYQLSYLGSLLVAVYRG